VQDASQPAIVVGVSTLEKSDFVDVFRFVHGARGLVDGDTVVSAGVLAAIASGFVVASIAMGAEPSKSRFAVFVIAVVLLLVFAFLLRLYLYAPALALESFAPWEREVQFEFCSSVLRSRTGSSFNQSSWEFFNSWSETPQTFVIRASDNSICCVVPKRAFADDAALGAVRELLRSRVPEIVESKLARKRRLTYYALVILCIFATLLPLLLGSRAADNTRREDCKETR
jgi:hypothetical protein